MTPNEYQELAMRTNDGKHSERLHNFPTRLLLASAESHKAIKGGDLLNGVMGLCGEAGEVSDLIKKMIFHGHSVDIEKIKKELGDVCWYIAMICYAIDLDLEDVMQANIDKLKKRYPNGFSEQNSINRLEG